jgi:arylsulfatase A-like enzyme
LTWNASLTRPPHERLLWRVRFPAPEAGQQKFAIRQGRWKLVRDGGPPALYDLTADPGETVDLSAKEPERVTALRAEWDRWNATLAEPTWSPRPTGSVKKRGRSGLGRGTTPRTPVSPTR